MRPVPTNRSYPQDPDWLKQELGDLVAQLPLRRAYASWGRTLPTPLATVTRSPRIVIGMAGVNNMRISCGSQQKLIALQAGEAVYVDAESWNEPLHDAAKTFVRSILDRMLAAPCAITGAITVDTMPTRTEPR